MRTGRVSYPELRSENPDLFRDYETFRWQTSRKPS
jgi:hypothetical protein